jgi:hypothetical protein
MATSKASTPTKAGEVPANIHPHVSYHDMTNAAVARIDAMLKGGVEAVTFIASALLVGYLAQKTGTGPSTKMDVIRDEFKLLLKKKGLGGTQSNKYIDYAMTSARKMYTECQYGMEMAALIAATTPDKAHNAVKAWVSRHCTGKKTEHGFKLSDALNKLNVYAVFIGAEADPQRPETLADPTNGADPKAAKVNKARKALAAKVDKDPEVLRQVSAEKLADTVSKVITFDKLIIRHVQTISNEKTLRDEMEAVMAAYNARLADLRKSIGSDKAKKPEPKLANKRTKTKPDAKAKPEQEAIAA